MKKNLLKRYALTAAILVVAIVGANLLFPTGGVKDILIRRPATSGEILGMLQGKAQIASTQVELRRMGIYDSDTELLSLNPTSWKLGRRACVVPVDMIIKFGIDLRKMNEEDVKLDTGNVVRIRLPQPEIIDYSVEQRTDRREVITISTLARSEVGEQTIQNIKNRVSQEILRDTTIFRDLSIEIKSNTRSVFRSMLRSMGMEPVFID